MLIAHLPLVFRRAYGGTATRAGLRAAVVGAIYFIAVMLAMLGIVLPIVRKMRFFD